jgi:hypothetical protein
VDKPRKLVSEKSGARCLADQCEASGFQQQKQQQQQKKKCGFAKHKLRN